MVLISAKRVQWPYTTYENNKEIIKVSIGKPSTQGTEIERNAKQLVHKRANNEVVRKFQQKLSF